MPNKHSFSEFMAADTTAIAKWNSTHDGEYIVLSMALQIPLAFSEPEAANVPADATEYYSYKRVSSIKCNPRFKILIYCFSAFRSSFNFVKMHSRQYSTWHIMTLLVYRICASTDRRDEYDMANHFVFD